MNESIKAVLALIIAACALIGIVVWLPGATNEVSSTTWWLRIGCPILGVICLVPLIWAQRRKDKVPDLLFRITPRYFERDGFCFAVVPYSANGDCAMHVYFQNRYDRPCSAQILLRGSPGLFSGRPDVSDITLGVSCGPAEFGRSSIPWSIPSELQGKMISLSVYAGVRYPSGRGKLLRFRDGMRVGAVGMDTWREGLQVAGALVGALVISRPARIKLRRPSGASPTAQGSMAADTKIIWRLGDPATPLEKAQSCAQPNGCPATPPPISKITEGPPSVS
jgi:hypothetical protein